MKRSNRKFSVVEINGLIIKNFVTGLGTPFFKKVVNFKGLKSRITKYKTVVFKIESKFDIEAYVSISGLLCERFQLLRPGIPKVRLSTQQLYTPMHPVNAVKVDVLTLKECLTNAKRVSYNGKLCQ